MQLILMTSAALESIRPLEKLKLPFVLHHMSLLYCVIILAIPISSQGTFYFRSAVLQPTQRKHILRVFFFFFLFFLISHLADVEDQTV